MNLEHLPIKLIFFVILLWPISRVWLRFKDGGVRLGMFLFWTSVWIAGVFMIFFPDFLTYMANIMDIGRGSDLVIYFSLIILFYLVFRTNVLYENLQHDLSKLVRAVALKNKKNKK